MKINKHSLFQAKNYVFDISLLLIFVIGIFLFPNTAFLKTITKNNILELINQERQDAGVIQLKTNDLLDSAALKKAETIFEAQQFAHEINKEKFSFWIKNSGYKYSFVGENLAIDFVSTESAVKAWLESETHKQNIMNPRFSETGIAIKEGVFNDINTILIVQIFGTPLYQASASITSSDGPKTRIPFPDNELMTSLYANARKTSNVYYFENNYLNAVQSGTSLVSNVSAESKDNIAQLKSLEANFLLTAQNKSLPELFNTIFILTLVLSLAMTFIYLLSNLLLKEEHIKHQQQS